ncbi:MAG: DUF4388 domain-containing protein [Candidatus Melainabacteria bacterium]|jgi:hypothetical protein|nr:DUF4388 domain-containing protein [Candidatus Melainabacteria bacterium]
MLRSDLTKYANSVGFVYDSGLAVREPLATVFQVDDQTVVTVAHPLILYTDLTRALKVRFPASGREFSIARLILHPKLDKAKMLELAKLSLTEPVPGLPLQSLNIAVLKLRPADPDLTEVDIQAINEQFEKMVPHLDAGLDGDLGEVELSLVIQTITNARKEGTISIFDERHKLLAKIFCSQGKVSQVMYGNLINEMAFYQIINQRLAGTFHFSSEEEPDWTSVTDIQRPVDMLLIESHRRLDELQKLQTIVGGPSSLFVAINPAGNDKGLNLDVLPAEVKDQAKLLWPFLDGATPLGELWQLCGLDDFAIYCVLQELIKTRQVSYFEPPFVKAADAIDIPLKLDAPLAPNDIVSSLWIDDVSMAPLVKTGTLLGSVKDKDPSHVLTDVGLPACAAGTPLFKDNGVIGIHCGAVPREPLVVAPQGGFHQAIWIAAVVEVLNAAGEHEAVKRITLSGVEADVDADAGTAIDKKEAIAAQSFSQRVRTENAGGCREVAKVQCPKCGRTSLELANFCKGCGNRLMADEESKIGKKKRPSTPKKTGAVTVTGFPAMTSAISSGPPAPRIPIISAVLIGLGLIGATAAAIAAIPAPRLVTGPMFSITDGPWVQTQVVAGSTDRLKAEPTEVLQPQDNAYILEPGKAIFLKERILKPSRMYVFVKQSSGVNALIAPQDATRDAALEYNDQFLIGTNGMERAQNFGEMRAFMGDGSAGADKLILVNSGRRCIVPTNPALMDEFVSRATDLLSCDDAGVGVEVQIKQFGEKFFDPKEAKGAAKLGGMGLLGDEIYLSQVEIRHGKPHASIRRDGAEQNEQIALPNNRTREVSVNIDAMVR